MSIRYVYSNPFWPYNSKKHLTSDFSFIKRDCPGFASVNVAYRDLGDDNGIIKLYLISYFC